MAAPTTAERGEQPHPPPQPPHPQPQPAQPSAPVRRRRAVALALVAAIVLTAASAWLLYGSSWLRVTQVKVTGTDVLTPAQVEAAAAVPLGGPLVSADTATITRRLTKRIPRIARVDVERSWAHTIVLKVTERTPAAIVESGRNFIEVDADGVRFAVTDTALKGVPVIELTPVQGASSRHFGTKGLLRSAVEVANDLPVAVRRQARFIRVRSYDAIIIRLTGDRTVMWGSSESGAEKAIALIALMKAAKDAVRFDVSAPASPAASGS